MRASNPRAQEATRKRALDWLLAMQSKDGGWAAFDVDNNWEIPEARSLRGSQRDARSDLRRYHRAARWKLWPPTDSTAIIRPAAAPSTI
jgi:hypothetical protein